MPANATSSQHILEVLATQKRKGITSFFFFNCHYLIDDVVSHLIDDVVNHRKIKKPMENY